MDRDQFRLPAKRVQGIGHAGSRNTKARRDLGTGLAGESKWDAKKAEGKSEAFHVQKALSHMRRIHIKQYVCNDAYSGTEPIS
jgi:hypothetical protein